MPPTLYIIYYNIYYVFTTVAGSASVYTNITVDMLYIYSYYCSYVYACRVVFNAGHAQLTSVL